jgi:hypothetical protein
LNQLPVSRGHLGSFPASRRLPPVNVVPAYHAADAEYLHEANDMFHGVEAVDDERRLNS